MDRNGYCQREWHWRGARLGAVCDYRPLPGHVRFHAHWQQPPLLLLLPTDSFLWPCHVRWIVLKRSGVCDAEVPVLETVRGVVDVAVLRVGLRAAGLKLAEGVGEVVLRDRRRAR